MATFSPPNRITDLDAGLDGMGRKRRFKNEDRRPKTEDPLVLNEDSSFPAGKDYTLS